MDCDFSHDPADVPRLAAAAEERGPRARLALRGRAAAPGTGGCVRRFISRGGSLYAQVLLQLGDPRPDGRLQVLPARRARDDRPGRDRLARLRVPDRDDVPGDPRRLPRRRGADHVRRPRGRRLEDEQVDRPRGDLEGARSCRVRALCSDACSLPAMREVTDDDVRERGAPGGAARRRRLLGALVRAVQSGRADPGRPRRRSTRAASSSPS